MKTKKFYNCFSYNQHQFLLRLGFEPITELTHEETNRVFWVYRLSKSLSLALKIWTIEGKNN